MRVLLDTHAFLWFITADARLSDHAGQVLSTGGNQVLLSIASVWEIAIKVAIGRLNRIELLPISLDHALGVAHLPLHHRDPFDRLLIAQAIREGIPLLSADQAFDVYPVQRRW